MFLWYGFEERWGAPVASDGRLRAHGAWSFQFAGPKGGGATAEVPAVGRASILTVSQIIRTQERVVEPWIDSNAALEAVAASGSIPKDAAPTGMGIQHGKPYTDEAVWRIDYAGHARLSRAGAMVEISTGRVVTTWS